MLLVATTMLTRGALGPPGLVVLAALTGVTALLLACNFLMRYPGVEV